MAIVNFETRSAPTCAPSTWLSVPLTSPASFAPKLFQSNVMISPYAKEMPFCSFFPNLFPQPLASKQFRMLLAFSARIAPAPSQSPPFMASSTWSSSVDFPSKSKFGSISSAPPPPPPEVSSSLPVSITFNSSKPSVLLAFCRSFTSLAALPAALP